ncbi:MAG: hypothetical protein CK425_10690 [Parachlamydia sp.]|nr:MAG: hypothetical protein CK425_10690 [Parachlamydia sp.]
MIIITSCSHQSIQQTKISLVEKEEEEVSLVPPLVPHMLKNGAYQLEIPAASPDGCYLVIKSALHLHEDCQEVFIKADGKLAFLRRPMDALSITFEPTILGEAFDLYLCSLDRKLLAYVHLIPFPLVEVHSHGYTVSGETLNAAGDFFLFKAEGFEPYEEIMMIAGSNAKGQVTKHVASKEGILFFIQNPAYQGSAHGNGYLLIIGKKGGIEVKYPWGTKLLNYSEALLQSKK